MLPQTQAVGIFVQEPSTAAIKEPITFIEETQSYIIEFTEEPLATEQEKLGKEAVEIRTAAYLLRSDARSLSGTQKSSKLSQAATLEQRATQKSNEVARILAAYKKNLSEQHSIALGKIRGIAASLKIKREYFTTFNGAAISASKDDIEKIKKSAYVAGVYPDSEVKALLYDSVKMINATEVWKRFDSSDINVTGKGVTIAVIDTGIDYTHPDLGGCLGPSCKVIGGYDIVNNDSDPMDDQGHGTHCAATAAGNGALKGVAPDAKIYAYKVLDQWGSGTFSGVLAGIEMAVDPNMDQDLSDHADVISMSLGGDGNPNDPLSKAIDAAVMAGTVAVVAAGNSGPLPQSVSSPGCARKALTVGAENKTGVITSFSSRGPVLFNNSPVTWDFFIESTDMETYIKPDVIAPGYQICAAEYDNAWSDRKCFDDRHVAISGTSMATPHVAGVAALVKQMYPYWTAEEARMALKSSTFMLNYAVNLNYSNPYERQFITVPASVPDQGNGEIDALKAYNFRGIPSLAEIIINSSGTTVKAGIPLSYISGNTTIYGTAMGRNFSSYLVLTSGTLKQSTKPVQNGALLTLDTTKLKEDSECSIALLVYQKNGNPVFAKNTVYINNLQIKKPLNHDIFKLGTNIKITGDANGEIANITAYYRNLDTGGSWAKFYQNASISRPIKNGSLAVWNTSGMQAGYYDVRIDLKFKNGNIVSDYLNRTYLEEDLEEGWPLEMSWEQYPYDPLSAESEFSIPFAQQAGITDLNQKNHSALVTYSLVSDLRSKKNFSTLVNYPLLQMKVGGFLMPVISDINNDFKKELIVVRGGKTLKILAFDKDARQLWSKDVEGSDSWGQFSIPFPSAADINNDGYDEIVIYNRNTSAYDSFMSACLAPFGDQLDYEQYRSCLVNCLSQMKSEIYTVKHDGTLLWKTPAPFSILTPYIISIADLNQDNSKELIFGGIKDVFNGTNWIGLSSQVFIFNKNGLVVSNWTVPTLSPVHISILPSPVIGNFDSDNDYEIVVSAIDYQYFPSVDHELPATRLFVYNMDGTIVPGWPKDLNSIMIVPPAIGDINNDGRQEIIAASEPTICWCYNESGLYFHDVCLEGGIYVFDRSGNLLNGWPTFKYPKSIQSPPALGDVNGDKYLEIVVSGIESLGIEYDSGSINETNVLTFNGSVVNGWPQPTAGPTQMFSPIIYGNSIFLSDRSNLAPKPGLSEGIFKWNANGQMALGFPKLIGRTYLYGAAMAVEDLDNDGRLEIIGVSDHDADLINYFYKRKDSIYVWDVDETYDKSKMYWPTYMHDNQRTGCYDCSPIATNATPVCSDGTPYNRCSNAIIGKYCDSRGQLVSKCSASRWRNCCKPSSTFIPSQLCSCQVSYRCDSGAVCSPTTSLPIACSICPTGTVCRQTSTSASCMAPATNCSDGTAVGRCSNQTPNYCTSSGTLISNCTLCGCPPGKSCNSTSGYCYVPTCSDGTLYGQCSPNLPNYCDNGQLVDKCTLCGCPSSYSCNTSTNRCFFSGIVLPPPSFLILYVYRNQENSACISLDLKNTGATTIQPYNFSVVDSNNNNVSWFVTTSALAPGEYASGLALQGPIPNGHYSAVMTGAPLASFYCSATPQQTSEIYYDEFQTLDDWVGQKSSTTWHTTASALNGTSAAAKYGYGGAFLNRSQSTSGYSSIEVSFWAKASHVVDAGEYFKVDWFDGASWVNLLTSHGISNYTRFSYQLPASADNNPNFMLRLGCYNWHQNTYYDVCSVDSLRIVGKQS